MVDSLRWIVFGSSGDRGRNVEVGERWILNVFLVNKWVSYFENLKLILRLFYEKD